jgi:hypothetical protein
MAAVGPVVGLIDVCLMIFTHNGGPPSGNEMFFGLAWELVAKVILTLPFGFLLMTHSPAAFGDLVGLDCLVAINWAMLGVIIGTIRGVRNNPLRSERG